jgi:hypothetical protein
MIRLRRTGYLFVYEPPMSLRERTRSSLRDELNERLLLAFWRLLDHRF